MDSLSEMEKNFVFNLMVHFRAHEEVIGNLSSIYGNFISQEDWFNSLAHYTFFIVNLFGHSRVPSLAILIKHAAITRGTLPISVGRLGFSHKEGHSVINKL